MKIIDEISGSQSKGFSRFFGDIIIFLVIIMITFFILGETLFFPFFTIDDSDLLKRASTFFEANGWMSYFKAFEPGIGSNRRYWPGFLVYTLFRYQLLGLNSVLWHGFQLGIVCVLGITLATYSKRMLLTPYPGIIAYCIFLTAGSFDYQTNWFNFVFNNSFEPIICSLLALAVLLLHIKEKCNNKAGKFIAVSASVLIVLFCLTIKENVFIVIGGMSLFLLVFTLFNKQIPNFTSTRIVFAGFLVASMLWGCITYRMIPKDNEYAGVNSLVIKPGQLWLNFWSYIENIYKVSGFYIFGGLIIGSFRIIKQRLCREMFLILTIFASFQIFSVIIWPDISLRLISPAFASLVFVSTVEYYLIMVSCRDNSKTMKWIIGTAIGLFMLGIAAGISEHAFEVFLAVSICIGGVLHALKACVPRAVVKGFVVPSYIILFGGLFVNGVSHVASYPLLYKTTEFTRHQTVVQAAQNCPVNGKVIWFVPPGGEIFPYSCDIHAELFFKREDITIQPAAALGDKLELNRGDMIVLTGDVSNRELFKDTKLDFMPVIQSGYISSILSYKDYLYLARSLVSFKLYNKPLFYYHEGRLDVYQIRENNWQIDPHILMQLPQL